MAQTTDTGLQGRILRINSRSAKERLIGREDFLFNTLFVSNSSMPFQKHGWWFLERTSFHQTAFGLLG